MGMGLLEIAMGMNKGVVRRWMDIEMGKERWMDMEIDKGIVGRWMEIGMGIGFRSRFNQRVDYMRFNEKSLCFRWQETTKLMLFGNT